MPKWRYQTYSSCCNAPVLGNSEGRLLYCYGCGETIRSFKGWNRKAALKRIRVEREQCYVRVMLFGVVIAYARDVPNLEWRDNRYRKVGRSTYKYFIQGTPLVSALGFEQCYGQDGFRTLRQAERDLLSYLEIEDPQ